MLEGRSLSMKCRSLLGLVLSLASGCSHPASGTARLAAPTAAQSSSPTATQSSAPTAAQLTPPTTPPVASAHAVSALLGDEQLPEPWRARFRAWLSAQAKPTYVRVVDAAVISNAVSVVLERR